MRYGTPEAVALAERWMATIETAAYRRQRRAGAREGRVPARSTRERFLAAPNVRRLPEDVRGAIARHGMRNGLLTSIAPTGTISLLAGNVSSGIEPVFDFRYERRVLERDGRPAHGDGRGLRATRSTASASVPPRRCPRPS